MLGHGGVFPIIVTCSDAFFDECKRDIRLYKRVCADCRGDEVLGEQ
jgi:hypothetical protein